MQRDFEEEQEKNRKKEEEVMDIVIDWSIDQHYVPSQVLIAGWSNTLWFLTIFH